MSSTQKSSFSSAKRVLATVASAAMLFALLPAGIALGESPENVCPPPDGAETFPDVDTGVHADNIECAAGYGIVQGYPDGEYKPELDVFRAQMATFVVGLIEEARGEAMPAGDDAFDDDETSVHEENINKLAAAGIVQGQDGDYNPARKVNRAAMATFIANAIDYVDDQDPDNNSVLPAAAADHFTDDETSPHEENINRLADAGIVEGQDSATEYNPGNIVFRGQMASFVIESASVLEDEALWAANDPVITTNQSFGTTPTTAQTVEHTTGGQVAYTVDGLEAGEEYEIAVFPCGDYGQDASVMEGGPNGEDVPNRNGEGDTREGTFTFRDQNLDDVADDNADTMNDLAYIVWEQAFPAADVTGTQVTATADDNGEIDFLVRVDSNEWDCAVPVVWDDADNGGDLDLVADSTDSWNVPSEDFSVGGIALFHRGEAPNGYSFDDDVLFVDLDDQFYVEDGSGYQIFWGRDGDTYFYDGSETSGAILQSWFETYLSIGDYVDDCWDDCPNYDRGGGNEYEMDFQDTPGTPINVTATMIEDDNDDVVNDVHVTWELPAGVKLEGNDDQGCVELLDADDLSNVAGTSCTNEVDTLSPRQSETEFVFNDVGPGDYVARVYFDSEADDAGDWSLLSNVVTNEVAGPVIEDAVLTTDTVVVGLADTSDVWTLEFNETMVADFDARLDLTDPDGDTIRVVCQGHADYDAGIPNDGITSATCAWSTQDATNDTLTITLDEGAEDRNFAGDGNIEYPLTITDTDDLEEADFGLEVDLADSPDTVIDAE